jgi:hypothetical protein
MSVVGWCVVARRLVQSSNCGGVSALGDMRETEAETPHMGEKMMRPIKSALALTTLFLALASGIGSTPGRAAESASEAARDCNCIVFLNDDERLYGVVKNEDCVVIECHYEIEDQSL